MKFVIQRVNNASVTIDEKIVGKINKGFLVFIGVSNDDTKEIADKMIKKLIGMRIFDAGAPDMANEMYEYIIEKCREMVKVVETGEFGADMKVKLENDGPFTIVLDNEQL